MSTWKEAPLRFRNSFFTPNLLSAIGQGREFCTLRKVLIQQSPHHTINKSPKNTLLWGSGVPRGPAVSPRHKIAPRMWAPVRLPARRGDCLPLHFSPAFMLSCNFPRRPDYGDVTVMDLHAGGVAHFHCHLGYELQGAKMLMCINASKPHWSSQEPNCSGTLQPQPDQTRVARCETRDQSPGR